MENKTGALVPQNRFKAFLNPQSLERALSQQQESEIFFKGLCETWCQNAIAYRAPQPVYAKIDFLRIGLARVEFFHPWVKEDSLYLADTALWRFSTWQKDELVVKIHAASKTVEEFIASGELSPLIRGIIGTKPIMTSAKVFPEMRAA